MKTKLQLATFLLKRRYDPNQILFRQALLDALKGCNTVLDIGCGVSTTLKDMDLTHSTGFEGYLPDYNKAMEQKCHNNCTKPL